LSFKVESFEDSKKLSRFQDSEVSTYESRLL
jgi:hypothetical protein